MNPFTKALSVINSIFGAKNKEEENSLKSLNTSAAQKQSPDVFNRNSLYSENTSLGDVGSKLGLIKDFNTSQDNLKSLNKLEKMDGLDTKKSSNNPIVSTTNNKQIFKNVSKKKITNIQNDKTTNNTVQAKPQQLKGSNSHIAGQNYSSYQDNNFLDNMFMMQFPEIAPIYRPDSMLAWVLWYSNNHQNIASNFELDSHNMASAKNEYWAAEMPSLPIGVDGISLNKTVDGMKLSFTDIQKEVLGNVQYNQKNNEIITGDNNLMKLSFDDLKSKINLELDGKSISYSADKNDNNSSWHIDTPLYSNPVVLESNLDINGDKSWGVTSFDKTNPENDLNLNKDNIFDTDKLNIEDSTASSGEDLISVSSRNKYGY